jgi:hypothetical protein
MGDLKQELADLIRTELGHIQRLIEMRLDRIDRRLRDFDIRDMELRLEEMQQRSTRMQELLAKRRPPDPGADLAREILDDPEFKADIRRIIAEMFKKKRDAE